MINIYRAWFYKEKEWERGYEASATALAIIFCTNTVHTRICPFNHCYMYMYVVIQLGETFKIGPVNYNECVV